MKIDIWSQLLLRLDSNNKKIKKKIKKSIFKLEGEIDSLLL